MPFGFRPERAFSFVGIPTSCKKSVYLDLFELFEDLGIAEKMRDRNEKIIRQSTDFLRPFPKPHAERAV
jgi:hypothetical protein